MATALAVSQVQSGSFHARHAIEHLERSPLGLATGRVHFGEWSEARGRRAADAVLRTAPDTDAFFRGNDQIARGVADALRERGVHVPGDIAVVGYDTWDTMAPAGRPPPTPIDLNLAEIGRVAALRLLEAIGGGAAAPSPHSPHRPTQTQPPLPTSGPTAIPAGIQAQLDV
ncbi:substrate-binding domain-containing protein [Streptomyces avermitilis]|uniref:substrate-binding domain-containing protein n=1 Tax=Streptomyces avermitilis TaxID=33903 RepID=UPI003677F5ED